MRRSHSTLLMTTIGGSFVWHVLSLLFFSSVVVVTVGDQDTENRTVNFTELDFDYYLTKDLSALPISKHFKPPVLPDVLLDSTVDPLTPDKDNRMLFDARFVVDKTPVYDIKPIDIGSPPSTALLKTQVHSTAVSNVEIKSNIYDIKGKPVERIVVFKPSIPDYPLWAEVQGREFQARFIVVVSSGGRVVRVRMLLSTGFGDIDRISSQYLRKWKFAAVSARVGIQKYMIPIGFVLVSPQEK